tara:strand:+ start:243 stop:368 length:126 start_codon:yes stop_codon:yes gene_type:complete
MVQMLKVVVQLDQLTKVKEEHLPTKLKVELVEELVALELLN